MRRISLILVIVELFCFVFAHFAELANLGEFDQGKISFGLESIVVVLSIGEERRVDYQTNFVGIHVIRLNLEMVVNLKYDHLIFLVRKIFGMKTKRFLVG